MIRKGDAIKFKPECSDDGEGDLNKFIAAEDSYAHDTSNPRVLVVAVNTNLPYPPTAIVPLSMIDLGDEK